MKIRTKLFLTCVTGALVIGTGPMIPNALAQSAMPAAEPVPFWWFHGEIEAGGRVFLNNPEKNGIASQGGKSEAKFFEYKADRPGPFTNGHLATGSNDGLYQWDLWAKNAGYDDQRFNLDGSQAGQQYFNFEWDQTPHNYGSGLTLYNGVGSNALTLPAGLSNQLFLAAGCLRAPGLVPAGAGCGTLTAAQAAAVKSIIDSNVHQTDLGIRRDTASVDYRWTPTDAWDIKVDYSHLHRAGTQVDGVVFSPGTSGVVSQVPKPVNDTTDNFGLNGEYAGNSPWGQKFTFKLGYSGSIYRDAYDSYTVENPFCATGSGPGECARTASPSSPSALMSLWPSNQANGFSATLGADLPAKSRYMGTVSYTMMRQNEAFLPFTNGATVYTVGNATPGALPGLPASSLNGEINTFLSNNVLTTKLTPELKSKLSYRYYDFDNGTPENLFRDWVLTDVKLASAQTAAYAPVRSISVSYARQNAGADLNWNPNRQWNLGAGYGYERYDWNRADVDVTNEHSGKVYADWKPNSWITTRASWLYSERRYDTYDYFNFVGNAQWPTLGATHYSPAMRQFYLNNRDRNKGQLSVAIDVARGLTVTPTAGYQQDAYSVSQWEVGLTRNEAWRSGVELAYIPVPGTRFLFSYMYEDRDQQLKASTVTSVTPLSSTTTYNTSIHDRVHTFIAAVDYAAIPDKLDLMLSYTNSYAKDGQPVRFDNGALPSSGQYTDVKTVWQRLEATAKYRFDKETVQQLGWKGEVTAKLRYAWERNSVANMGQDVMSTYMYGAAFSTGYGYMDWMAYNNPNYDVHLIGASLAWKW